VDFAFLILTAEDEQPDGTLRARENVVHEAGLFQGKLGFKRLSSCLSKDARHFSNITGLTFISFQRAILKHALNRCVASLSAKT